MLENGTSVDDPGLGGTPAGYLLYDAAGHMSVQLMRRNRGLGIDCSTSGATKGDNNSQSINGYDAYFGTYEINEMQHTVTHHLEGALVVSDVGKNLVRGFQLSGDKLTLVVPNQSPEGSQTIALTWKRLQ